MTEQPKEYFLDLPRPTHTTPCPANASGGACVCALKQRIFVWEQESKKPFVEKSFYDRAIAERDEWRRLHLELLVSTMNTKFGPDLSGDAEDVWFVCEKGDEKKVAETDSECAGPRS